MGKRGPSKGVCNAVDRIMAKAHARTSSVAVECVLEWPLGYWILRPLDGRTLDQKLMEAGEVLGLKSGEHVVVTVARKEAKP